VRIAKFDNAVGFVVADESVISTQPTVLQPDAVLPKIMSAVTNVEAWAPKQIAEESGHEEY
jgi:hypothetical protein